MGNKGSPNYTDDDFELVVTRVDLDRELRAIGIWVANNELVGGESLRVFGESDIVLQDFHAELPNRDTWEFMGLISPVPVTGFEFNESTNVDNICIRHPAFGLVDSGP